MQMYTKKHFVNASELSGEKNHTGYQVWTGQEPEDETSFNGNEDYQPADG